MEIIIFTATGIVLYVLADALIKRIETARGAPLVYRQLWFFAIILPLALVSFEVIQRAMN